MNNRLFSIVFIAMAAISVSPAFAQLGAPAPSGSSSVAAQLPLSGRTGQSGGATATQSAVPGTNSSVNTLNTNITIQGPYTGSVDSTVTMPFNGKLSLHEAVQRGLAANTMNIL